MSTSPLLPDEEILVFGVTGQLARELQRSVPGARFLSRAEADLEKPGLCAGVIGDLNPGAVINAAAYTAVDRAESEEALSLTINGSAPVAMARSCADLGIPFVTVSTDYVFDGHGTVPFRPGDATAPLGAYGRSKQFAEEGVMQAGGASAVLRTSWVFSAYGGNFVKTMLRLSETRDELNIVADQIGGPTSARSIAGACVSIARQLKADPAKAGIYHFSGAPDTSWACFARETFELAGRAVRVTEIPTSQYPTPAARPLNSRLDCSLTETVFGLSRPDWRADLKDVLIQLGALA